MLHKEKCKRGSEPKSNSPSQVCETPVNLFVNCSYDTRTYGSTTLTDSETQTLFDSDRLDQLNVHLNVIARCAHFNVCRQSDDTGYVSCSEIELRSVVVEERSMTAALFLLERKPGP